MRRALILLTAALLVVAATLLALDVPRADTFAFEVIVPPREEFAQVEKLVRTAPDGSVLNLDAGFGLVAGVPAPFSDGFHAALLARAGIARFEPEVAALDEGRYRLVITNPDGSESIEEVDEPTALVQRSVQLINSLRHDGWRVA